MRSRQAFSLAMCLLVLVLASMGGLMTGTLELSPAHILQAISGAELADNGHLILWEIRIPRLLLALFTGAVLTLAGFFMQVLIKNPLADPYIMGLTAGAGFGVNLVILGLIPITTFTIFTYPLFAAAGALLSLLLLLVLGFRSFMEDNARLLIAGVAVSSIFMALTGFFIYRVADSDQVRRLVFWTFGSLGKASWESVYVSGTMALAACLFGLIYARRMDVMLLGDLQAQSLGMKTTHMKLGLLLISSITVGGTVAFTGPIGFIGMMIPHFSRALFGAAHRPNMVLGALMGASFLAACDVLSRWLLPPAGLPIGIVTAILGVPFFLYILFSGKSYL